MEKDIEFPLKRPNTAYISFPDIVATAKKYIQGTG